MKTLTKRLIQRGFSLIELMIVVAIIGILAAIAIPNFQKFQAKSRQAEAKADLAAIYTAERAFQAEYQVYAGDLIAMGYYPSGIFRYNHGFGKTNNLPVTFNGSCSLGAGVACQNVAGTALTAAALCPGSSTVVNGAGAYLIATLPVTVTNLNNTCGIIDLPVAPPAIAAANAAANAAFLAAATSKNVNGGNADTWTIDQGKALINTVGGI